MEYLEFEIRDLSKTSTVKMLEDQLLDCTINILGNKEVECFLCFIHEHGDENDNIYLKDSKKKFKLQLCGNIKKTEKYMVDLSEIYKLFV